jgi:hypothetical protein
MQNRDIKMPENKILSNRIYIKPAWVFHDEQGVNVDPRIFFIECGP